MNGNDLILRESVHLISRESVLGLVSRATPWLPPKDAKGMVHDVTRAVEKNLSELANEVNNLPAVKVPVHEPANLFFPEDWLPWHFHWRIGTRVRKRQGSSWQGRIVGLYRTSTTREGYAVESEREPGSVQIYPYAALDLVND